MKPPVKPPTDDADLYKSGVYILMDEISSDSCKDAIEFILKQNTEKKKQKRLQFLINLKNYGKMK